MRAARLISLRLGAAAAGAAWLGRRASLAEPPPAELADDAAPAPPPARVALFLPGSSRADLAAALPRARGGAGSRAAPLREGGAALGERVSGPAVEADAAVEGELRVLAYAESGATRTALVALPSGHPAPPSRLPLLTLASAEADAEAADAASEALWRALEAARRIDVLRDADGLPLRVRVRGAWREWEGVCPAAGRGVTVLVRASGEGTADALASVRAMACPPEDWRDGACASRECAFCAFMKGGPCKGQFLAWEACVDASRAEGTDFIAACGAQTLALKGCTDEHPEYYGMLSPPPEGEADAAADAEPTPPRE